MAKEMASINLQRVLTEHSADLELNRENPSRAYTTILELAADVCLVDPKKVDITFRLLQNLLVKEYGAHPEAT